MHRGLVALSASAVAAIYMAGFLRTQAADATIGAAAIPIATVSEGAPVAAAAPTSAPPPLLQSAPAAQPAAAQPQAAQAPAAQAPPARTAPLAQPTPAPASSGGGTATQAAYKDGTYTGQGTSRRGDVWVSVQVQSGRIANVNITRTTLQYPLRDIQALPGEVVQRQSAQVDIVSRATYSSMAFRQAVSQALSSAHSA
jgi:uncharacterized protein with FMN-binding domain